MQNLAHFLLRAQVSDAVQKAFKALNCSTIRSSSVWGIVSCCKYFAVRAHDNKVLKVKWTKISTLFILVQFLWNVFNMNKITILWSFRSIEVSISEVFTIKNFYFLALVFVEQSEKLSAKTACDVNVGQVKKSGKFKTKFFKSTGGRNYGSLWSHKPGKIKQFVFKSCKPWL